MIDHFRDPTKKKGARKMKEYKGFYKQVGGNEGGKCHYNTRLDVYGCGCSHDCSYCYAKSLLSFRGLWDAPKPSVADLDKVARRLKKSRPAPSSAWAA